MWKVSVIQFDFLNLVHTSQVEYKYVYTNTHTITSIASIKHVRLSCRYARICNCKSDNVARLENSKLAHFCYYRV